MNLAEGDLSEANYELKPKIRRNNKEKIECKDDLCM